MKYTMIYTLLILAIGCTAQTNNSEKAIKQTIIAFAKAADQNDTEKIKAVLDDNFRIAMNQMFGSTEVQIVDKDYYISKISTKEWGGDTRSVTITDVIVAGKNATAKVTLVGKSTMVSLLTLVMDVNGNWRILQDAPVMA